MNLQERTDWVLDLAREAGFARAGVAAAGLASRSDYFDEWLARGNAGTMTYLARYREIRGDLRNLLPGAKSIIVVADQYKQCANRQCDATAGGHRAEGGPSRPNEGNDASERESRGRIAQYAWGRDYHRVLRKKLHHLADRLHEAIDEPFESRVCVDTAPVIEREWAAAAGVGWIGKNTMVLHETLGSFFFLGEIVTTLALKASPPVTDRCGTCTRCLQACPTGALIAPHQMDARRCISYLTIEHEGEIDAELQPLMGDWVYGCDICQDVCPYNHKAPPASESAYAVNDRNPLPPLASLPVLQKWTQEDYGRHLSGSAVRRASLSMLKRNAEIAAFNVLSRAVPGPIVSGD